jgi:hypothetical protein
MRVHFVVHESFEPPSFTSTLSKPLPLRPQLSHLRISPACHVRSLPVIDFLKSDQSRFFAATLSHLLLL